MGGVNSVRDGALSRPEPGLLTGPEINQPESCWTLGRNYNS